MDLRIVKTKKVIREAFLELRAKNFLEKIKVRDICRQALINKSTFYNHYSDVFALSEELENEVLAQCFNDFKSKNCLFSDSRKFFEEMPKTIETHKKMLLILFNNRFEVLFAKQEKQLRNYYKIDQNEQDDILLAFVIGGTIHALQTLHYERDHEYENLVKRMSEIIHKIMR